MQIRYNILSFFLLLVSISVHSQWIPENLLSTVQLSENDSNKLTLAVDMTGFFKDNEYFSPVELGRTLPGTNFLPRIAYQIDNKFRAELGIHKVYFSGEQKRDNRGLFIDGIFARMQYAINPEFNLVLGNIYGGLNHRLIEPLYQWESQLIEKPESGLQLVYKNERFFGDVWVDWRRYIEFGDSVPELLTFGMSFNGMLTKPQNQLQVSIPFQLLINHSGGQINVSPPPMIVMGNAATGICMEYSLKNRFLKSVALKTYIAGYYDKLPDKTQRPYRDGWGVYPVVQLNSTLFSFMTGYWYAKQFYALNGEQLLGSFNPNYPNELLPERKLLTTKLMYSQQLLKNLNIGAGIETYTDLNLKWTDYSFNVYLRFNPEFILKKF
ncbi:MAG: hypothetical protein FWD60_07525 [Candidatus Azobacteroides sp.]|nr:hypothetical protein [Candidatus Azobacteroides sp.]